MAPGQAVVDTAEPLDRVLWRLLKEEGLSVKDASRKAAELTGTARNEAYSLALQLKDSDSPP